MEYDLRNVRVLRKRSDMGNQFWKANLNAGKAQRHCLKTHNVDEQQQQANLRSLNKWLSRKASTVKTKWLEEKIKHLIHSFSQ